jgi:hypothetical protein
MMRILRYIRIQASRWAGSSVLARLALRSIYRAEPGLSVRAKAQTREATRFSRSSASAVGVVEELPWLFEAVDHDESSWGIDNCSQ